MRSQPFAGFQKTNDNLPDSVRAPDETDVLAWLSSSLMPGANGDDSPLSAAEMKNLAFLMYQGRRDRDRFFASGLFSDPAWDLLLAAYCLPKAGRPLSVSGLCHAAAAPPTTALRWISHLCQIGMLSRTPSATDQRVTFVTLTNEGREQIEAYLNRFSRRLSKAADDH